jgi:hypothetical protein
MLLDNATALHKRTPCVSGLSWWREWGVILLFKHVEHNIKKYPRIFMRRMDYPVFYLARMDI